MIHRIKQILFIPVVLAISFWIVDTPIGWYFGSRGLGPVETCMWHYWVATWPVWKVLPSDNAQDFVNWTRSQCDS